MALTPLPRIRRVKCDEARPSCQRCLAAKRVCDGYKDGPEASTSVLVPLARPAVLVPGPLPAPSASSAWTTSERRAFDFYMNCSFPRLFSPTTAGFWGRIVPALCLREPAVRHAVFAVGSLHEKRFHGRCQAPDSTPETPAFAADQYGRALRALRLWQDPAPGPLGASAASVLPLIACSLFVCVEFMMGDRAAAHTHIVQGRRLLARYGHGATAWSAPTAELIRREIVPVFVRISLAPFLLRSSPKDIPESFRSPTRAAGPAMFASLSDAEQAMFDIHEDGLRFAKASRAWRQDQARGRTSADQDADIQREHHRLLVRLDRWDRADTALGALTGKSSDLLTRVYFHLSKIFIGMALELGDLCYDAYTAQFASIVILVGRILDAEDTADPDRRCRFSFEMGITPPLLFTSIKCRHPGLRRRAVELLRRRVAEGHQDNIWDSGQVIKAASRVIELEEMRGWTLVEPSCSVVDEEGGSGQQGLASGQVSTDWSPDVVAFDQEGRPKSEKPTFVYKLRPNPQPILPHRTGESRWESTAPPRPFPKLARFFRASLDKIPLALAEEAWASLIASASRLESRDLASAAAAAAAWTAECSVPTCLQIPEAARIQNVSISPLEGTGSWVSFHVQPNASESQVGILREFM